MRLAEGENVTTIDKSQFALDLTDAIIDSAIVSAARDELSIDPSEAEISSKAAELTEQIEANQGVSIDEFFASRGLPVDRLQVIARQQVIRDKLIEHFTTEAPQATDQEAETMLESDRIGRTTACVSHILVATEEEAQSAKDRIDGGEEFSAVAMELGTDGTAPNGGSLGCEQLGLYVPAFAEAAYNAPLGEVAGPVQSDFGFHLILVESKEEPSLEQLKEEINQGRVADLVDAWIVDEVETADITVDPQYGTWVLEPSPQVSPPTTAPATN